MTTARQSTSGPDTLTMAIALALALHAAVIGLVHFDVFDARPDSVPTSLDVILVDWATDEAPDEADFLAQATQRGGGEAPEIDRPAEPLPFSADEPEQAVEQEAVESTPEDEPDSLPEVAQVEVPEETVAPVEEIEFEDVQRVDATRLVEASRAMARSTPDRFAEARDFAERPRRKFISANTQEHLYAGYMRSWVAKVERIGNMNYPEQARRHNLSGSLVLSVDVLHDGSVEQIRVLRSSGHDVLDEAAVRIVRLSAPFAPLPEAIRQEVDVLTITRTWQFSPAGRLHGGR
ncbi:energy transducer TonB [Wenzhouxiangella sp. AB-CW3]|uniref:energy transducer TonB n=1 Tax=Wenzhouxiangella sp. AB-CW3 TaxID=2771012 RepID=UPI00168B5403|nr:energy transducer TonB [Wenzhouxiangella sp. AB-CW3]QOC22968.1 energy transducer TonB [Wenzhouxiangella sp. AB-CW3]